MRRRDFLQATLSLGAAAFLPGSVPLSAAMSSTPATVPVAAPLIPIWDAATSGHWDVVMQWLKLDPSLIAVRGEHDSTLLHLATQNCGTLGAVEFLISHGADVNAKDSAGRSPLYWAAGKSNMEMFTYLVSQGADIHVKSHGGNEETLLHAAMRNQTEDDLKIVQYLVEHGCDVNARDCFWATPLLYANAMLASVEVIKYLVAQGADVNAEMKPFRKRPLYYAITAKGDFENIKFLVAHGADVNAKLADGETSLHLSTYFLGANVEFVKYLVLHGADVHAKNDKGETALDQAKRRGNTAIVEYLASVT